LAKNIGYDYDCFARPGTGNLSILESILSQSETNKNDLYVIGWTWIDRFDYLTSQYNVVSSNSPHWNKILPNDKGKESEF
jgi:hypothetical protein